jgi:hypothetical protein
VTWEINWFKNGTRSLINCVDSTMRMDENVTVILCSLLGYFTSHCLLDDYSLTLSFF